MEGSVFGDMLKVMNLLHLNWVTTDLQNGGLWLFFFNKVKMKFNFVLKATSI